MTSLFHALNTGTLAAWLSVAWFGAVGILVPEWRWSPSPKPVEEVVTQFFDPEILLDDGSLVGTTPADPSSLPAIPTSPEALPAPPELPELAEQPPLPEIPDLPPPAPERETPVAKPSEDIPAKPTTPPRRQTTNTAKPKARGTEPLAIGGPNGAGSGMSDSSRLAAGRMPAPSYPSASRRAGQTGTVTVAFTVDSSGRVISAYAASPSPWPLLNEEAVRTVRRWKFPPGGVMKLQRPIVFQLR